MVEASRSIPAGLGLLGKTGRGGSPTSASPAEDRIGIAAVCPASTLWASSRTGTGYFPSRSTCPPTSQGTLPPNWVSPHTPGLDQGTSVPQDSPYSPSSLLGSHFKPLSPAGSPTYLPSSAPNYSVSVTLGTQRKASPMLILHGKNTNGVQDQAQEVHACAGGSSLNLNHLQFSSNSSKGHSLPA